MFGIYCLVMTNLSLFPELRDAITLAASEMIMCQSRRQRIRGEGFEGVVKTEFRHGYLGSISGFVFTAEVETNAEAKGVVSFIIRESDARHWIQAVEDGSVQTVGVVDAHPHARIRYGNPGGN